MTELLQLVFSGVALGCIYSLIALGFVIVFKATGVFNFAHGEFVMMGAYLVFLMVTERSAVPFYLAVPIAAALTAAFGVFVQVVVLRTMVGESLFSIVMVTLGLSIVMRAGLASGFGFDSKSIGDPYGAKLIDVGGVRITHVSIATVVTTVALVAVLTWFFQASRYGVAMRATAQDHEAASAMGVNVRSIYALAWALAAILATVAGVFLAGFPRALDLNMSSAALLALPAAILGGFDSIVGAITGGVIVGVVQVLVAGYQPEWAPWLGSNFHQVAPYVILIVVLMVRPYGLFGTKEITRV
ncbi:branched-chain amino acid ABC transporter permease [Ilumatobacter coccineus]|uniref:Putative amino acid ABC transporter permease protein n=1 Tax=Ilumatobacter coccineus (strain NBRC 103263 / KCTC 29153 / YM16-304) TaxID=1313172 RepID=A0A6C7E231_ILUCY|nr:branched-chain amino acid ABC transporter permease [Ilumatobacter coccineus]BAN00930.1 putative amino acid ABC transporter permease protein [Ilumatobacter coccineus YM16-304]